MKLLLDIKDNKVSFVMELLKYFSFIKFTLLDKDNNSNLKQEIEQAVKEINLIKKEKSKGIPIKKLLNEL